MDVAGLKADGGDVGAQSDYGLEELVKRINSKNLHEAVDFGRPEGSETW